MATPSLGGGHGGAAATVTCHQHATVCEHYTQVNSNARHVCTNPTCTQTSNPCQLLSVMVSDNIHSNFHDVSLLFTWTIATMTWADLSRSERHVRHREDTRASFAARLLASQCHQQSSYRHKFCTARRVADRRSITSGVSAAP